MVPRKRRAKETICKRKYKKNMGLPEKNKTKRWKENIWTSTPREKKWRINKKYNRKPGKMERMDEREFLDKKYRTKNKNNTHRGNRKWPNIPNARRRE